MREIKFRALFEGTEEWFYWELDSHAGPRDIQEEIDWETVGQFTGLKDRDGVDVYQGDLLEVTADVEGYGSTSYGGIVEVTAETCGYRLKPIRPTFEELEAQGKPWDSTSMWHVCEEQTTRVIGNVHQHHYLLTSLAKTE